VLFTQADLKRRKSHGKPLPKEYRVDGNGCLCEAEERAETPLFSGL
jgi:hypothetical protein